MFYCALDTDWSSSAWTSFPSINPWPQIIAGVPIGFSVIVITLQGLNYIIDCYTVNANSALAAMTFVRSWFGAGFPLFAAIMFHKLGVSSSIDFHVRLRKVSLTCAVMTGTVGNKHACLRLISPVTSMFRLMGTWE